MSFEQINSWTRRPLNTGIISALSKKWGGREIRTQNLLIDSNWISQVTKLVTWLKDGNDKLVTKTTWLFELKLVTQTTWQF